ncbi:MAG: hypothetical protein OEV64_00040 [Desulfobulbaceae bacterium]|nr:hypothetical protein [Desulfobulbaceae bacterium]
MKNGQSHSDHIRKAIDTTLSALSNHTDRDSSLIAAELINDSLQQLLRQIVPTYFSASQLFEYPAPLSSLSARADASAAFRLIPKQMHKVIRTIIQIRGNAARSTYDFSLSEDRNRLEAACLELNETWRSLDEVSAIIISEHIFSLLNQHLGFHREKTEPSCFGQPENFIEELLYYLKKLEPHMFGPLCLATMTSIIRAVIAANKMDLTNGLNNQTLLIHALKTNSSTRFTEKCSMY